MQVQTVNTTASAKFRNKSFKNPHMLCYVMYPCVPKSESLNILQQRPQICSDLNKILHTQDDVCYKHYYTVSYKSALTTTTTTTV